MNHPDYEPDVEFWNEADRRMERYCDLPLDSDDIDALRADRDADEAADARIHAGKER